MTRLLKKIFLRNDLLLTKKFKYQVLIHMILATPQGGETVFQFLINNHKLLYKEYGGQLFHHLLETLAKCMKSRHHIRIMTLVLKSLKMDRPDIIDSMKMRSFLLAATETELRNVLLSN